MSAEEFEEWRVMFAIEQLHPGAETLRHAQLLAAVYNGPLTRRSKKLWSADDFTVVNPWSHKKAPGARKPQPTAQQIVAQVAAINQSRRRH